jgi:hypothetical protein
MYIPLPRGKRFFISTTFVPQKKYRFPLGRGTYKGENGPSPWKGRKSYCMEY